jgi:putative intracellular protease/amidase
LHRHTWEGDFLLFKCCRIAFLSRWPTVIASAQTGQGAAILRVGLLLPSNFSVLSFAPIAVFEMANGVAGERFYDIRLVSEKGERTANSLGAAMDTEPMGVHSYDTLLLGAGLQRVPPSARTLAFLREIATSTRRSVLSVGAFTLAETGLLDSRRATTHWAFAEEFQERFPKVKVEGDRIFIADGPIWTSAGMTAGIDLALGVVERDMGKETARTTAQAMVVYRRRAGGQSQHSPMLEFDAKSDRVASVGRRQACRVRHASLHGSSAVCLGQKPGSRPPERSKICASRRRGSCLSKVVCQSKRSHAKPDLVTGSGCAVASLEHTGKHHKTSATLRARSRRFSLKIAKLASKKLSAYCDCAPWFASGYTTN